ncbi:MAG: hypothetical protein VKQ33_02295 [Candidatus Sericytochromatia bacterium]|nr:hypothetical protein [Candidatus Sericytochromatia bacterium]
MNLDGLSGPPLQPLPAMPVAPTDGQLAGPKGPGPVAGPAPEHAAASDPVVAAGTMGLERPPARPGSVNVDAAASQALARVIPGASFEGDWPMAHVAALVQGVEELPRPLVPWWHGHAFRHVSRAGRDRVGADEPGGLSEPATGARRELVQVDPARRLVLIDEEVFALGKVGGKQAVALALTKALGRSAPPQPGAGLAIDFPRLSGWQVSERNQGVAPTPPRPYEGEAPHEAWPSRPGAGPAGPSGVRQPGASRTRAPQTGRLPPEDGGMRPAPRPLPASEPGRQHPGSAGPAHPNRGSQPLAQPGGPRGSQPLAPAGGPRGSQPLAPVGGSRGSQPPAPAGGSRGSQPLAPAGGPRGSQPLAPAGVPHGSEPPPLGGGVGPAHRLPHRAETRRLGAVGGREGSGLPTDSPGRPPRVDGPEGGPPGRPGRGGKLRVPEASPAVGPAVAVDGGGMVEMPGGRLLVFEHDADAAFVGGHKALDPREDLGEALKALVHAPERLMKVAPAKLLVLNAEARVLAAAEVRALAADVGVDLRGVLTDLAVSGRATPATLRRIADHHGLSVDRATVQAREQTLLVRGGTLEAIEMRLSVDLATRGAGSARAVREAEALLATYTRLLATLPLTAAPQRVGLTAGQRVFRWLATGLRRVTEAPGGRIGAELAEVRAQFQRLPLAAQLRVAPELALGATWLRLSVQERATLRDPVALQGLVARASEGIEEVAYLPQQLNASERRALAVRTLVEGMVDPGGTGRSVRSRLGGTEPGARRGTQPFDPASGLKELVAVNGQAVLSLLGEPARRSLADRRLQAALRQVLAEPLLQEAIQTLRSNGLGAEPLRASILRFSLEQGRRSDDVVEVCQGLVQALKQEHLRFAKSLDGGALELVLVEVARQVREGNVEFVNAFKRDRKGALEEALGPWAARLLSPSERKLLEDPDYRRHLLADVRDDVVTGQALAEEARQYRIHTENIQQVLARLLEPDRSFRAEFARDPVGTLIRWGLFPHLPLSLRQALSDATRAPRIETLVKAIEETMSPVLQRQLQREQHLRNLRAAVGTVNASNYGPLLGILEEDDATLSREVRRTLETAMTEGQGPFRAGLLRFL